jgi:hypothetical protein
MSEDVGQAAGRMSIDGTRIVVDGLAGLALTGLLVVTIFRRNQALRRVAEATALEESAKRPLRPGPATIMGRVLGDGDDDASGPAHITIEIEQRGREWQGKNGWYHEWKETSRRVDARPFYVLRPNGERVRIEPDQNVFLVDLLDGTERLEHTRRRRTATLRPGERVSVTGVLVRGFDPQQGGYRDAGPALVLKPPPRGRMLVSTEPLADRHTRRAGAYRGLAIAIGVILAILHGLLFANVHLQRLGGKRVEATIDRVTSERYWVSRKGGGGYWAWRYHAHARTDEGSSLTDQVSYALYTAVQRNVGPPLRATFLVGPFGLVQYGTRPVIGDWKVVLFAITMVLFFVVYLIVVSQRPWYEQTTVKESKSGRL